MLRIGVGGHPPIPSRGNGDGADFRSIGKAAALKLVMVETAIEGLKPFLYISPVIDALIGLFGNKEKFFRGEAEAEVMLDEEIIKLIGPHRVLGLLGDLSVFGRQKLRGDGRIDYV